MSLRILQALATPYQAVGGMERMADALADGLRARGHAVSQLFLGTSFAQLETSVWQADLHIPTTRLRIPTPRSAVQMARTLRQLAALLRRVRPDVVHVHYPTWETTYLLALRSVFGYRIVLTSHVKDVTASWPLARRMMPTLLRRADAVTTVSQELADHVVRLQRGTGPLPLVIPNGIDTAFWSPEPTRGASNPTVVTVARLETVKAQDVLIDAFKTVVARVPGARLVVIGDGSQRTSLDARIQATGLENAVTLAGLLSPEQIREHLRTADVFALPSRDEGMPLALIEALATGCPAVATAVGGVPDVLTEGGELIPPEDAEVLADRLVALLLDDDRRAHLAAEALRIGRRYGSEAMVDRYQSVLLGASATASRSLDASASRAVLSTSFPSSASASRTRP